MVHYVNDFREGLRCGKKWCIQLQLPLARVAFLAFSAASRASFSFLNLSFSSASFFALASSNFLCLSLSCCSLNCCSLICFSFSARSCSSFCFRSLSFSSCSRCSFSFACLSSSNFFCWKMLHLVFEQSKFFLVVCSRDVLWFKVISHSTLNQMHVGTAFARIH